MQIGSIRELRVHDIVVPLTVHLPINPKTVNIDNEPNEKLSVILKMHEIRKLCENCGPRGKGALVRGILIEVKDPVRIQIPVKFKLSESAT